MSPPHQEDPLICAPHIIRGHGGVALGRHRRVNHSTPLISCQWLSFSLGSIYIFTIYLPSHTNSQSFSASPWINLHLLPPNIIILGDPDFNSYPRHPSLMVPSLYTTPISSQRWILHQDPVLKAGVANLTTPPGLGPEDSTVKTTLSEWPTNQQFSWYQPQSLEIIHFCSEHTTSHSTHPVTACNSSIAHTHYDNKNITEDWVRYFEHPLPPTMPPN